MCVVAACVFERVTAEQTAQMYQANPHGAGIAWKEWTDAKGNVIEMPPDPAEARKVYKALIKAGGSAQTIWKKGMNLEQTIEMVAKVPMPFVVHFRVPSLGGPSEYLTHPFPITAEVELELEGATPGWVLFHNGHYPRFKEQVQDMAIKGGYKIPTGKWSDSRSFAWMAHNVGMGVLEFINEKVCIFGPGPDDIELFGEYQWTNMSNTGLKDGGIYVSNTHWKSERVTAGYMGRSMRQVTGPSQKADEKTGESDKEEPQLSQKATPMTPTPTARSGKGHTASRTVSGSPSSTAVKAAKKGSGGDSAGGPFDFYHASVRLWQNGSISKKQFKKSRYRYELMCRKLRLRPEDRPFKCPPDLLGAGPTVH